ncbi:hypothetical protein IWX90DRAFT_433114 [Phyllosticta citrichinensis]|uniref:BTB domain-containing protein n=1 Tax=Phyllosticta citrichinensis TaxID=1130410 RepID=A0ABR1XTL2_9PEZI
MSDTPAQAYISGLDNQDVSPAPPLSEADIEECYCYLCHDCYRGIDNHDKFRRTEEDYRKLITKAIDDGKMVKVSVGKGDSCKIFNVHETLLCSTSDFFKKALNGHWKESKDRLVSLPEEDPAIFKAYFEWLMLNTLLIGSRHEDPLVASTSSPEEFEHVILECYVLGDHVMDSKFKNFIIEEVYRLATQYHWVVPREWLAILPTKLPESSGFVRFYMDFWALEANSDWLDDAFTDNIDDSTALLLSITKKALDYRCPRSMGDFQQHHLRCQYFDGFPEVTKCKHIEQ